MKLELIKVDQMDVYAGYWVKVDGKSIGAISAPDAQKVADHVNIQEGGAFDAQKQAPCAPTRTEKHEGDTPESNF